MPKVEKDSDRELISILCDCSCADPCPQGRMGSETRCMVLMYRKHLSKAAFETIKLLNSVKR